MGDRGCRAFEENTVAEIVLPAGVDSPGGKGVEGGVGEGTGRGEGV